MDLQELRTKIDGVDEQLLPLFLERMSLCGEVAREKQRAGAAITNTAREREILSRVTKASGELDDYARQLYGAIFELSKGYQETLTEPDAECPVPPMADEGFPKKAVVACQGVLGAYSQQAADQAFGYADIMYMRSFEGVFQAVEKGLCRFGVLPIENSAHGSVTDVYDLMRSHRFSIVRAVKLHVSHSLLVNKGASLEDVRVVVSHEQAVGQCSEFLAGLKNVEVRLCENTAAAAKLVADSGDRHMAAISSEACAELYGLTAVKRRIQNTDNNYTRFIIIEKTPKVYPGANKISLMFSLPDRPGALASVMTRFSTNMLNLSKLESRPVEGSDFHYVFYVDLEAPALDPAVKRLMTALTLELNQFTFLGAYQEV